MKRLIAKAAEPEYHIVPLPDKPCSEIAVGTWVGMVYWSWGLRRLRAHVLDDLSIAIYDIYSNQHIGSARFIVVDHLAIVFMSHGSEVFKLRRCGSCVLMWDDNNNLRAVLCRVERTKHLNAGAQFDDF